MYVALSLHVCKYVVFVCMSVCKKMRHRTLLGRWTGSGWTSGEEGMVVSPNKKSYVYIFVRSSQIFFLLRNINPLCEINYVCTYLQRVIVALW